MNFKELLLQAKFGDRTATTELLMLASSKSGIACAVSLYKLR